MAEQLQGTLERIVFANEEKQFLVAEFQPEKESRKVTITGILPGVQCGESLLLQGEWVRHPQHGSQFRVESFEARLPASVHGIRRYLGSGLIPGIGKTYAGKIVDHFGEDTLKVISEQSARLREVPGIGAERARRIKQGWEEQRALRSVMVFLQTYGISANRCLRLVKRYGEATEDILRKDPYRLADEIEGIGFATADQIAVNLGLPSDGAERIRAALRHSLQKAAEEGHTAVPRGDLVARSTEVLGLSAEAVEPVLDQAVGRGEILAVQEGTLLQRKDLAHAETRAARSLRRLQASPSALPGIVVDKAIEWAAAREGAGFAFAPEQAEAIRGALEAPVAVLTGGPGTGKTTLLRALTAILRAKKVRIALASPTGRAAQRLAGATGMRAHTVHRLLGIDPQGGFQHGEDEPLETDFLIVDEASMLDIRLAASLLAAVPVGAHLLLVGDANQLPSVGPGDFLRNLIESGQFPVVRLQRVFRQAEESPIVDLAYRVLGGEARFPQPAQRAPAPVGGEGGLQWILAESPEECVEKTCGLVDAIGRLVPGTDPLRDLQVLVPLHKGVAGVGNFNQRLKEILNPRPPATVNGRPDLAVGDKVIQQRNNYEVGLFNGDIGRIVEVDAKDGRVVLEVEGERYALERGQSGDLALAYAITVHKSQGSEYPVLVLPLLRQHYLLLRRNLVYTALTRGKQAVFFVGDLAAYGMAVRQTADTRRSTDLVRKIGG